MVYPVETPSSAAMSPSNGVQESPSSREVVLQQLMVAKTVLLQAVDLVDEHLTSDEQLTVHSKYLPGSTIGAFTCFCMVSNLMRFPS